MRKADDPPCSFGAEPERARCEGALAPSHLAVEPQVSPALLRRLPHGVQVLFRGGGICWLPRMRSPPSSMSGVDAVTSPVIGLAQATSWRRVRPSLVSGAPTHIRIR